MGYLQMTSEWHKNNMQNNIKLYIAFEAFKS